MRNGISVKKRLQQLLSAAEDIVSEMNHDAKIDFSGLRSPASGEANNHYSQDDPQPEEA